MSEERTQIATDRKYIDLDYTYEVMYWTQALGVSRKVLEDAVRAVGTSAAKVQAHLGK
jgi:hypothetical protein